MAADKVNINSGRPITIASQEEMKERGAADGAAARQAGLYQFEDGKAIAVPVTDIPTLADTAKLLATQAAFMTVSRNHVEIAQANATVATRTNEFAAASAILAAADIKLAAVRHAKASFDQRVQAIADPDLDLTLPLPRANVEEPALGPDPVVHGDGEGRSPTDGEHAVPAQDLPDGAANAGRAWRFPRRRDMHPAVVALLLAVIAGAEFGLNAKAFESVREAQSLVLLLAALVGVGMVTLAHRIGSNARDLLEVPAGAKGRSPAKLVEVALEVPALLGGIVGVASIRASYFSLVGIRIPTFGLVCIQFALAVAAIGTSMAGRNQAADESRDLGREVQELEHQNRRPHKACLTTQNLLVGGDERLRVALQGLVNDYNIQLAEVALGIDAYVRAYALEAGIKVTGTSLASFEKPDLVAQAEKWLAAHPVGTLAHLDLPYTCAEAAVIDASGAGDLAPAIIDIDDRRRGHEEAA